MFRKTTITLLATILLGVAASSCNSDNDESSLTYNADSSTAVTAFSLRKNKKILSNLDSVFFSIDLVTANIFNADSLPFGTDVSKLQVNINTNNCSKVRLTVPGEEGKTTEIDYLTNSTETVDFSHGPVMLQVVSADGINARDYVIKVNVHRVEADLLYWNQTALGSLPTSLTSPAVQKAVRFADKALCLTGDGTTYCLASTSDPDGASWKMSSPSFPSAVAVETLTATDSALFILSTTGELLTSTDGLAWSSCGVNWINITGSYEDKLLGMKASGSSLAHVTYPATTESDAQGFPVAGLSQTVAFSNRWATSKQLVAVGGRNADGSLSDATWAYDGTTWVRFNRGQFPAAEGRTLVGYPLIKTDTISWRPKEYQALLAFGGKLADGTVDKTMYISLDMGFTWKKADDLLQLPEAMPAMAYAQALVFDATLSQGARSQSAWAPFPSTPLPSWYALESTATSRADSWQCPYIYLFGGVDAQGSLYPTLWRGVIARLTFQPLQ